MRGFFRFIGRALRGLGRGLFRGVRFLVRAVFGVVRFILRMFGRGLRALWRRLRRRDDGDAPTGPPDAPGSSG